MILKLFIVWPVVLWIRFSGFPELLISIIHFLFQFSGQPFTCSSFNIFLYCWRMSIENFGYFCIEIFEHFIDIRCFYNQFPVDVFYIIAQVIMVMFVVTTLNCSWIVFDHVDFQYATNHGMITEGQRERWSFVTLAALFVNIRSIEVDRSIDSYSCCILDNLGKSQVVKSSFKI